MPPRKPAVSVIVVCKDARAELPGALQSVWAQKGAEAQLIVVDGGSTDGTSEWLEECRPRLSVLLTGPDAGVYDAMNKGLGAATGGWVLFLGADDRLAGDECLAQAGGFLEDPGVGVAVGEAAYDDGRVYRLACPIRAIARNFVHHQAAFYRRSLFAEHGGYDASLSIMGDYDFNLRLWKRSVCFKALPLRIAECRHGGLSDRARWKGYAEEIRIRHRHFGPLRCLPWDILSRVRFLRKQVVRRIRP